MHNARSIMTSRRLFNALLIAIVLALYAASLNFGLIWDDPKWYQQGAGQSLGQIFTALETYQYYRPLAVGWNRLMVSPAGVYNAPLAHLVQIVVHLSATLAVTPVLRTFKIDERGARISAIIFALYPLSYQAVAWQAPTQPVALLAVFSAVLAADRFIRRDQVRYLAASLVAYAVGLLVQESALPFVVAFGWLAFLKRSQKTAQGGNPARQTQRRLQKWWPLLHVALALAYFVIWLNVPRQAGVTGRGLQLNVLAYVLQAIVFPIANLFSGTLSNFPVATLAIGFAALTLILLVSVWRMRGWRTAVFAGAWIGAGAAPIVVGLSWSYVRIGSRLLYPASLGIALVWGCCIAAMWTNRAWQRFFSLGLAGIVIASSIGQWRQMQQVYFTGTQHLDHTIAVLTQTPDQTLLFINYPDRIELRPAPYPLGNWGLILAPVVQNLADYANAKTGYSARTESLSAFQLGANDRAMWPYTVSMRGEDTSAAQLFEVAAQADRLLITDYLPDGQLRLREVGSTRLSTRPSSTVAMFGEAVRLRAVQLVHGTELTLTLTWQVLAPLQSDDTIFVHHWRAGVFVNAYDSDSLGGLIPPAVWRVGNDIVDVHHLAIPEFDPARDELRIGLYNRLSGARYPAVGAQGQRLLEDAVTIKPQ